MSLPARGRLPQAVARRAGLDHAQPLLAHVLAIFEARLGPDHPDTVRSRERLAVVMAALENRQ